MTLRGSVNSRPKSINGTFRHGCFCLDEKVKIFMDKLNLEKNIRLLNDTDKLKTQIVSSI